MRTNLFLLLILSSCTTTNSWVVDSIASGSSSFDSTRLRFSSPEAPLTFEMLRIGEKIEAFLTLKRPSFTQTATVLLSIGDQTFEEETPLHEGRMRLRLSEEMTQKIVSSLQADEKIVISVDGCEEILEPSQFTGSFAKFQGKDSLIQKLFKVPL